MARTYITIYVQSTNTTNKTNNYNNSEIQIKTLSKPVPFWTIKTINVDFSMVKAILNKDRVFNGRARC